MTQKQKQCLLAYLGLYSGAIDGIWGKQSQAAEEEFARIYGAFAPEKLLEAVAKPVDFWAEAPNFTREEFACKCGKCGGFPEEPSQGLVRLAQRVRSHFDAPATVSSGVRCRTHNERVGGVANSRHLRGLAMDFTVRGRSAKEVLEFVLAQPQTRYAYAIDGNYVHMDVEET